MNKDDCIFCKIVKGDIPSCTIYEDDDFKAFLDVSPANRGHALIVPKNHYDNIFEIDKAIAGKLFSLATDLAKAIKEETNCEGLNVVQNNGEVAGQTVNHFHLHLIPRFKGDKVNVKWVQLESDMDDLAKLAESIKGRI